MTASAFGIRLVFTTAGASLACAVMSFPLMLRAIRLSLEAVDAGLEQAARTFGARPIDRFFNITPSGHLVERGMGCDLRVRIPAREVILASTNPGSTSVHNVIAGSVRAINQDTRRLAALTLPGRNCCCACSPDAVESLGLVAGCEVVALVKSMSIEILPG